MLPSALPARALAAAVAVVLTAGIVSAGVGGGADGSSPDRTAAGSTTSTTAGVADAVEYGKRGAGGAGGGRDAGAEPFPSPPPEAASGQQDLSGAEATSEATPQPAVTAPPRPGTYRYQVIDEEDGGEPESREDEVRIEDLSRDGATARQRLHMNMAFGAAQSEVVWTSDGMRVESTKFEAFGAGQCDWEPDMEWLRQPLDEGAGWQFASRCTMEVQGMSFEVELTSTVSVGGRSTAQVDGTTVEVVQIRRESTVVITGQGFDGTSKSAETELFAPARGLLVSAEGTWDAEFGAERRSGRSQRRLLHLDPG